ncbi:hypothetical protein SLEP1_g29350 [Rubroshorea leprosula]|uniref:Uncharacterized protein n=1 Tax=Rubroshorea leprosula TaxID=152421 RepID=A0AAV5K348_9ROSI|nr:hypothetical protein SLEP1_g29350 [Rubroshorea leprosula]
MSTVYHHCWIAPRDLDTCKDQNQPLHKISTYEDTASSFPFDPWKKSLYQYVAFISTKP